MAITAFRSNLKLKIDRNGPYLVGDALPQIIKA